jgi:phosphohistidine phosphatase
MKTLHIMRHAKSSWDLAGISDIDRPLLSRGIFNSAQVAEMLLTKYSKPDVIYCSNAARATHTALIMARNLKMDTSQILIKNIIYSGEIADIFEMLAETSEHVKSIMLIGHNPTFTNMANLFLDSSIDNLPTSGIVSLDFKIKNWNVNNQSALNKTLIFPNKE